MSENKGLVNIDLGGMSEVGKALIEKVADAIGGLYKPHQIVRVAQAQAKADIITAQAQVEIEALQRRALERFVAEEAKKQSNIEEITQKAVPLLEDKSQPAKVEDDWITNFFDKCRIVSDDEMQNLWAKILAGEVNSPGKYSKRTVNLVADLDHYDAELFRTLCGFCWALGGVQPLIFDYNEDIYKKNGIQFTGLTHLDSIGLINFDNIGGFLQMGMRDKFRIHYYGRPLDLERQPGADANLGIGKVILTQAGHQLVAVCGSQPVEGFYEYVAEHFRGKHYLPPLSPSPETSSEKGTGN